MIKDVVVLNEILVVLPDPFFQGRRKIEGPFATRTHDFGFGARAGGGLVVTGVHLLVEEHVGAVRLLDAQVHKFIGNLSIKKDGVIKYYRYLVLVIKIACHAQDAWPKISTLNPFKAP
jgi:hypothetical protein